jgi:hypothetical protein
MSGLFMVVCIAFLIVGTAATFLRRDPCDVEVDPAEAAERLATADDIVAARAEFDRMLIGKGLATDDQIELIRSGTRSRAVVTGMQPTGHRREDFREVILDVMVKRPEGGQFAAHQVTLIPESALAKVTPGSVIDTYYRSGDESAVAVCVSHR